MGLSRATPDAFTFAQAREILRAFARERDWDQHHSPRNLILALVGEVGELAEIFQWRKDSGAPVGLKDWSEEDRNRVAEEMSDCVTYLIRFADRCDLDLSSSMLSKLAKNAKKYPKDQVKGSP